MRNIHIHIEGQVQGVGFRPFVYRQAKSLNLNGWVCNGVDGVHIEAEGDIDQLDQFISLLQSERPTLSRVTSFNVIESSIKYFSEFKIIESTSSGNPNLLITPDIGLCDQCRKEIQDTRNLRYQYPFTTCTQCGPRYSIMRSLPYDRPTTSMNEFVMCSHCHNEYHDPVNRRYFSQTNSCPQCAIDAWIVNAQGEVLAGDWNKAFPLLLEKLSTGNIIAIKGIGGYLLMVDATQAEAISRLRHRKHRPTKPFALMYPGIDALRDDTFVNDAEAKEFQSIQSPIVLVKVREHPASGICTRLIAPGLATIGAMQPYTAMFELIMSAWKKPVIATSANISGSPILYEDDDALHNLSSIADYFLMHNREIEIAQDDSVVRFTPEKHQRIVLRRSRGFAPTLTKDAFTGQAILAMGADMKSAFTLQANGRIYTSQYLGDLESCESQESFNEALNHLLDLIQVRPEQVLVDAHPNYFSTQAGQALAKKWSVPLTMVQHHEAHAFSVLAENKLLASSEPVLNVVWDGTGYGKDGNSWGGEFFEYNTQGLNRIGHMHYVPVWQGDKMARDCRLSALFIGNNSPRIKKLIQSKFSEVVWSYYSKLTNTEPEVYTSSIGRLFDAVACLTGVSDFNSFEGESAMRLEAIAQQDYTPARYLVKWIGTELDAENLLNQVAMDVEEGIQPGKIAYKFHHYLADVIHSIVEARGYKMITLSGGVFQNALLVDLIINALPDVQTYLHQELSPNDENISFGQLASFVYNLEGHREHLTHELIINNS